MMLFLLPASLQRVKEDCSYVYCPEHGGNLVEPQRLTGVPCPTYCTHAARLPTTAQLNTTKNGCEIKLTSVGGLVVERGAQG
jgi:hypothetical protein